MSAQVFGMTADKKEFWAYRGRVYMSEGKAMIEKKKWDNRSILWTKLHGDGWWSKPAPPVYHVTGLVFTEI